jgi:L-ascorbate peroxidase
MKTILDVKKNGNHITAILSISDLIQLGGYTAVEYCGGPSMIFKMGRQDIETEGEASKALAVTAGNHENAVQVSKFDMMGLEPEEYVAIMGSYSLGFASDDNKGKKGRWTMNPFVFDNSYFKEVLVGSDSRYLKTEADLKLLNNGELKEWVEKYAEDQNLFFENYAKAHVKISERGQEEHLLSEFDNDDIVDGGYQEDQGEHWTSKGNKKGMFGGI